MEHSEMSFVQQIRALPAPALAGFIEDTIALGVRGEVGEDFGYWVEVALERLDELAVEQPSADEKFYYEVRGDSMEPEFRSRTLFLIDTAQREVRPGDIFALCCLDDKEPFVKRAVVRAGRICFVSDNPKYRSEIEPTQVRVLGRAVLHGKPL